MANTMVTALRKPSQTTIETAAGEKETKGTMTEEELGLGKRSITIARHRTSLVLEPIF
ncbi:MAG: hypothetical protein GDA41_07155 [Rhodospirillales bacterium]|nr:hypothetical protein [Rhodospirillales bacterium]